VITARSEKIQRLRGLCQNDVESPLERLKAGERLLIDFGPSEGSVPIIRKVITAFFNSADPQIATRAQKLKIKLAKAMDIRREAAKADIGPPVDESITAGTSASQVPRNVTLSFSSLMEILEAEMGDAWRFDDKEFSDESRLGLLEAVLDSKPTIGSVQSLQAELYKKDSRGFKLAGTFPLVARFAKEYLLENGIADAAKYEDEEKEKVRQWIGDLDVEMNK
jgi:hypothetical protein